MGRHPEQRDDEIYMGNCSVERNFPDSIWETKRLGSIVCRCDSAGEYVPARLSEDVLPLFVQRTEVETRIREANETGDTERAGDLQRWLDLGEMDWGQ